MTPLLAAVGLGSNLGDREAAVRGAVERLGSAPEVELIATSSLYESEPWGYLDQSRFLNAVAVVRTRLGPLQLLLLLKKIESELGRVKTFHWGPREIDLDLLLYDLCEVDRRGLTVPHPGLLSRAFVLVPLLEAWPDLRLPDKTDVDRALAALADERRSLRIVGQLTTPAVR